MLVVRAIYEYHKLLSGASLIAMWNKYSKIITHICRDKGLFSYPMVDGNMESLTMDVNLDVAITAIYPVTLAGTCCQMLPNCLRDTSDVSDSVT